jgi:hypothetical protein
MAIYHVLVQGFPIVLLYTAALFIVVRTLSTARFAQMLGAAVLPLIVLGVLGGLVAYVLGLIAWPLSATLTSPLGRNHLLLATWSLAFWTVMGWFAWQLGERLWQTANAWLMTVMAGVGVVMITITGTLGGSMAGNPSAVSDMVRALGWEVYTTLYVPSLVLVLTLLSAAVLVGAGLWARRRDV